MIRSQNRFFFLPIRILLKKIFIIIFSSFVLTNKYIDYYTCSISYSYIDKTKKLVPSRQSTNETRSSMHGAHHAVTTKNLQNEQHI